MEGNKCVWSDVFDDAERKSLERCLFVTGFVAIVFGMWINLAILFTKLGQDRSYKLLGCFTTAACVRRVVPLIAHLPILNFVESTNEFNSTHCKFFAFLESFLAVLEIEYLTHVCIERYVVVKYIVNGWPIQKYHYTLFQCLCLFFASLYSFPPLFGIGQYGQDFACSFCTFDMILPESWLKYFVAMIFMLRSVKPTLVMFMMLTWACILKKKIDRSKEIQKQVNFTKNVMIAAIVYQFCSFPIFLIRGGVVFSQLLYSQPVVSASALYIKWAMLMNWVAPAVTALALFASDNEIRDHNMLFLYSTKEENETSKKTA